MYSIKPNVLILLFITLPSIVIADNLDSLKSIFLSTSEPAEIKKLSAKISIICKDDLTCYEDLFNKIQGNENELKHLWLQSRYSFKIANRNQVLNALSINKINLPKSKATGDLDLLAFNQVILGLNYIEMLKVDSALYYLTDAKRTFDEIGDDYQKWRIHLHLSRAYELIKDFENQESNLLKAYQITTSKHIRMDEGYALYNILLFYKDHGPLKTFNEFLKKYLLFSQDSQHDSKHQALMNLFIDEEEAIKSIENYLSSEDGKLYFKVGRCNLSVLLARLYLNNGYRLKAKNMLIDISSTCGGLETKDQIQACEDLISIYKKEKDFENAVIQYDRLISFRDSISHSEQIKAVYDYKEKYESEKKDKVILNQKLTVQKSRIQLITLGLGILILSSIGLFTWIIFKKRRKRELLLQKKEMEQLQIKNELIAFEAMIEGEEKERTRLSRELHDGIGALLMNIKARFQLLLKSSEDKEALEPTALLIDKTYDEVRRVSHNLMPNSLQMLGLKGAIEDLAYTNSHANLHIETQIKGMENELDKNKSLILFRIIQELITNAIKHSKGNNILIQLIKQDQLLSLSVDDNGLGFDANQFNENGLGLSNIKSRVKYLRGELDIDSTLGEGSSFNILIPYKQLLNSKE